MSCLIHGLVLLFLVDRIWSECSDEGSNCVRFQNMCLNQVYAPILLEYCRKTCDNCPGTCKDNSPRCRTWNNNGFCQSNYYTKNYKELLCSKTCGLCKGGDDDFGSGSGSGTP
ncbi:unnamed protein product [Bursaphelenchus xylophilus]|uniref:(pine wood nematode) hypothetical protein n=1 Tax=Bursaphelenchus xylophilus TaxID=6326 RepID=A0A1I7S2R4_BURXY|nr:unnamed protein product [Bursaphelenchus xylophilus]CAG9121698.1 unnamed protein product [Bursaphelenchus xylophilus]